MLTEKMAEISGLGFEFGILEKANVLLYVGVSLLLPEGFSVALSVPCRA